MTPETEAKNAIASGLEKMGWKVLRLNSGMAKRGKYYVRLLDAGTPDLLAFDPEGVLLWVECKAPFAKKRNDQPEQLEFTAWALSMGHRYVMARSLMHVLDYLEN